MDAEQIREILKGLHRHSENEVLELKEARSRFKTRELGQYFSALSNEANLRGASHALLVFGVEDSGDIVGTAFCQEAAEHSKGLQKLKRDIAEGTNNRITFRDILELTVDGKRVVAFVIPPATRGIPTQWAGAAWAREDESLVPLPLSKIDEIRAQPPRDWSREVVSEAGLQDLDAEAIALARENIRKHYGNRESLIDQLSDAELLDKAGLTLNGAITHTALLLLGTPESARLMQGALPKITWSLYEADGSVRTYQHFGPPFLLTIDDVLAKIRNEEIRLLADPSSLLPMTTTEYDEWSLRELIGNAIAHQDYADGGKVNIGEFPDRMVFLNEGGFIPGTLEQALMSGYKPPYYRNPFLVDAMLHVGMLDQNAMGIRTVCKNAIRRYMPLPSYDLSDPNRVKVELFNKEMSSAYMHILFDNDELPILTVLALDKVQKKQPLTTDEAEELLELGFIARTDSGWQLLDPLLTGFERIERIKPRSNPSETAPKRIPRKELERLLSIVMGGGSWLSTEQVRDLVQKEADGAGAVWSALISNDRVYRALRQLDEAGRLESSGKTRAKLWRWIV